MEDGKNARVQFVSCGDAHMAAVSENGDLFMWGENSAGQLGVRDHSGYRPTPQKVPKLKRIKLVAEGSVLGEYLPSSSCNSSEDKQMAPEMVCIPTLFTHFPRTVAKNRCCSSRNHQMH